jgi:acetylornithine deacetylase
MHTAAAILKDLVAFPVLGGQSNLEIIAYIEEYLHSFGVKTVRVPGSEGIKASLHCRIGPAVSGGVILSGHTDVVPVEGQDWTTDPWVLTEKEGKLYGRGSCDMKGFIACVLASVPQMVKADLKKPIYFAFSYDEEIGCLAGPALVEAIKSYYTEKPKYAIIGEPSLMQPIVGQKGICIYDITVSGSAGHSSRIKQEVSAINEAAKLVLWMEKKMDKLIADGQIDNRFTPPHTSLHVGMIRGGIAPNVIADSCSFTWDIRVIPKDSLQKIYNDFMAYVREREAVCRKRFPAFKIDVHEHHPPVPPLDTPAHLSVVDFIKKLSGNNQLQTVAYAAEAGQFANGGFETVICGPGSIAQAHRADEFIAIEQLDKGVAMMERLVDTLRK